MAQKPTQTEEAPNALDNAAGGDAPSQVPATTGGFVPGTIQIEDDFVLSPKEFPTLKVVSSMGNLKKSFNEGELVFDKPEEFVIAEPGEKVEVLVVGITHQWKEYVPGPPVPGKILKVYPSKAAALAAGERTEWPPYGSNEPGPTVRESAHLILLIKPNTDAMTTAPLVEAFGSQWIPVRFYADRSYYEHAGRAVIRASNQNLKAVGGYTGALWHGYTAPVGKNETQALHLGVKRVLTEEERTEFRENVLPQFGEVHIPDED